MMNDSYRPSFSDLSGDKDWRANEQTQFETQIVDHLFNYYDLSRSVRAEIFQETRHGEGQSRLTFQAFFERFPTFPIYLVIRKFRNIVDDASVNRIFSDFLRRKFVKEYEIIEDEIPDGYEGPVGLVFFWPHLKGQIKRKKTEKVSGVRERGGSLGLVLHNRHIVQEVPGVRIWWISKGKAQLVIEPLSVLLNSIDKDSSGRKWHPDE